MEDLLSSLKTLRSGTYENKQYTSKSELEEDCHRGRIFAFRGTWWPNIVFGKPAVFCIVGAFVLSLFAGYFGSVKEGFLWGIVTLLVIGIGVPFLNRGIVLVIGPAGVLLDRLLSRTIVPWGTVKAITEKRGGFGALHLYLYRGGVPEVELIPAAYRIPEFPFFIREAGIRDLLWQYWMKAARG